MNTFPLHLLDGHLFIEAGGELWLLDTGAPVSFGESRDISIAGERFSIGASYLGLSAATIAEFVGVPCAGLLGADVLSCLDHIFDIAGGRLTVSTAELSHTGRTVELDDFMGIPIVTARIGSNDHRMFFDTGAQYSYLQDQSLAGFPSAGTVTDFYPGLGQFQSDTCEVPMSLGGVALNLRCGVLPGSIGIILTMAGTEGIVGNAILRERTVGYFPRRRMMTL